MFSRIPLSRAFQKQPCFCLFKVESIDPLLLPIYSFNFYLFKHPVHLYILHRTISLSRTIRFMLTNRSTMKVDREITHPAHLHHKLRLEYTEIPFDCHGCKEAGIGLKYRCQQCKYELHKVCGAAQPAITHPFYKKCAFNFYYRPPDNNLRICDACHSDISGFVYHCDCCDFDLHPCCVNLPQVLNDGQNNTLYLSAGLSGPCHHCGAKGPGWAYRSGQSKGYNLHVSCVKKLLVESWLASYFNVDKNKVQELQTRIPSLSGAPQRNGSGVRKYCQMAGGAARLVMSALLGDPTAVVAGVVQGLISM